MHLISFDASSRQLGKLKKGFPVRIKKGSGFNLVVNPSNYHLVSRAFRKNKGVELSLSPEELDMNKSLSPEEHEGLAGEVDKNLFTHLPYAQGGSIFSKMKKALHSKTAKHIGRELKPLTREAKKIGKEIAHEKIAEAHMHHASRTDNPHAHNLLNIAANMAHSKVEGTGISSALKRAGRTLNKALHSKTARHIGHELKPLTRALKSTAKDILHEQIAQAHMAGADRYGSDPRMANLMNIGATLGHSKVAGMGLGTGLYAYPEHGRGMNAHSALKLANMATANANHQLAKMHNATVHGQITQPPIRAYWDAPLAPPSRGSGIFDHNNLIRGRGSLISQDMMRPPALQSQPYGANFHMQFQLPPEYHRFNDGSVLEGRGLYI